MFPLTSQRGDGGFDGSKLPVEETCKELVERKSLDDKQY
jgi:hypothetical protein